MSELQKFDGSQNGIQRLRAFFMRDRQPTPQKILNMSTESTDSSMIALDESFQKILKVHSTKKLNMEENKENSVIQHQTKSDKSDNASYISAYAYDTKDTTKCFSLNDTTLLEDSSHMYEPSDESFQKMETICNQTLSDQNNSIHEDTVSRSATDACDDLNWNMLKRLNIEMDRKSLGNATYLGDVEPPPSIWDNTIIETSPVKGITVNIPHLIPEECLSTVSDSFTFVSQSFNSSKFNGEFGSLYPEIDKKSLTIGNDTKSSSFLRDVCTENPMKTMPIDITDSIVEDITSESSIYKTANDSSDQYETGNETARTEKKKHPNRLDTKQFKKRNFYEDNCFERSNSTKDTSSNFEDSLNLAAAEKKSYSEDSLEMTKKSSENMESITSNESSSLECSYSLLGKAQRYSIIEISDDDDDEVLEQSDTQLTDLAFSLNVTEDIVNNTKSRKSLEFNDTLEEVEYIMEQGIKYLTEKGEKPQQYISPAPKIWHNNKTPSPISSPRTPNTVISKTKKPISCDKLQQQFKKPNSRIPQPRAYQAIKKPTQFQHIISPVGAYINNTAKVPITAKMNPSHDVFQSKAVRELDYVSKSSPTTSAKEVYCSLPKKAYISSETKHIVDQRKPISIPGGDKIHRYLQQSMVPSVIRHEGKLKMNKIFDDDNSKAVDRTIDSSIADLSTMSGDVSVLVLKDAKNYCNK